MNKFPEISENFPEEISVDAPEASEVEISGLTTLPIE